MIKVIIVEDEEKVCQLIIRLVNWEQMGMEIVGVAHDGIEALEMIEKCVPDLVITDIRMPGCDGLEMIRQAKQKKADLEFLIISGYRYFDYAQNAIKFGVGDYLLKPINREELSAALIKMRNLHLQRTERLSREERLKMRLKRDIHKLRNSFFADTLLNPESEIPQYSLEWLNEQYQFTFKSGSFQMIAVKIDYERNHDFSRNETDLMEGKIEEILRNQLQDVCLELWTYSHNSFIYALLNYEPERKKDVRQKWKAALDEIISQGAVFASFSYTLGVGSVVEDISQWKTSSHEARRAIRQRLVMGTGKIIEDVSDPADMQPANALLAKMSKAMGTAVELLDKQAVLAAVSTLKEQMENISLDGDIIYTLAEQTCETYLWHLRSHQFALPQSEQMIDHFRYHAMRIGQTEQLFDYLSIVLSESMDAVIEEQRQKETRPIRLAKQYIQQHYMRTLTLEEVSQIVGFNPTYFSTLFKKVTNRNFVDYLTEVRINHAKELLRETSLSVAIICEQTGYQDLKHFTKTFKKIVGLKPNEYRKLYS